MNKLKFLSCAHSMPKKKIQNSQLHFKNSQESIKCLTKFGSFQHLHKQFKFCKWLLGLFSSKYFIAMAFKYLHRYEKAQIFNSAIGHCWRFFRCLLCVGTVYKLWVLNFKKHFISFLWNKKKENKHPSHLVLTKFAWEPST